jgi:antitoxin (DNA-binding transcriptional repressor) of toxin-antitoxin stability system
MKKTNVSQAKSKFSSYLNDVKRGETVLIFDRNRLVARLEPVSSGDLPEEERVKALARAGIASAPRRALDVGSFLDRPHPKLTRGASVSAALLRERGDSP